MYDPSLYKDYRKLQPLFEMVSSELNKLDWRELYTSLASLDKDHINAPLTWYCAEWRKNNQVMFESNTEAPCLQDADDNTPPGAVNFHLELTNSNIKQFQEIKNYVFKMCGVTYAGFHFLNSNSVVSEHTDKDALSILFMYQVKNSDTVVLKIGQEKYTFHKGQIFAFDATINHSAYNMSDEDWIMFAIRCTQESFNL
jgi:hypothetical protein